MLFLQLLPEIKATFGFLPLFPPVPFPPLSLSLREPAVGKWNERKEKVTPTQVLRISSEGGVVSVGKVWK